MKKNKLLGILGLSMAIFLIGGCGGNANGKDSSGSPSVVDQTVTVAFNVDGVRYKTLKVKVGEKITETVADPMKEGYTFVGWYLGEEKINLAEYVVTKAVTFEAKFEEGAVGSDLNVNDKKVEGKEYFLVLGWWETTDLNEDGTPKQTSYMTEASTQLFYYNLINYLKAAGATDEQIAAISFRNYSSAKVADMGDLVKADGDVDILVGVGNNVNSTAGLKLHNESNDYKFATQMGATAKENLRYVACLEYASEKGVETFEWLKYTDAGKKAFVGVLSDAEIAESLVPEELDLTVTVHGDTDAVTKLTDRQTAITMPEITVPEDKLFKGFATAADGEVALEVAKDATLKYDDLIDLVAENAKTLDLYPVLEDKPVVLDDLVVYIQTGSNLSEAEAKLLEARFNATLTTEKVKFNLVNGNAAAFVTAVNTGGDADVLVGGNNPIDPSKGNFGAHAEGACVNSGAKHFADSSRKVMIKDSVATGHVELAKKFYNFVKDEAEVFEMHAAFWTKGGDWVTEAERATMVSGMQTNLETYMGVEAGKLLDTYNIQLTFVDVTTDGNKVADLGTATKALREGKGTDLIIGCGGNVTSTGGIEVVDIKDIDAKLVAAGRKVALVHDNPLARNVYDTYFVAQA